MQWWAEYGFEDREIDAMTGEIEEIQEWLIKDFGANDLAALADVLSFNLLMEHYWKVETAEAPSGYYLSIKKAD